MDKTKRIILNILEGNGHLYDEKSTVTILIPLSANTMRETFKGLLVTLLEIKRCLMFTNYYLRRIIIVRW